MNPIILSKLHTTEVMVNPSFNRAGIKNNDDSV